ncbi:MAG TPA: class I SAM-dependent methyltransferase [Kofleriaceae bacterium]|nr:class I SAM-dependent methyltransferase [Kofleriaceae bacterium]
MLSRLDRLAYHSQHLSFLINATVMDEAARLVTRTRRPQLPHDVIQLLSRRRAELHRRDLANVEAGAYPRDLLFDIPVRRYLRDLPRLLRDAPNVMRRMRARDFRDIPPVDHRRFPAYYRRTFHWQTDGYFSDYSAEVYELGVELVFRGTADVMRRQIIPPISAHVREHGGELRLLDIACGTGRTLHQLSRAHPRLRLHGVDLSPAYIKLARKRLEHVAELTLAVENAEALPWADATFDVVTSVYLFHELPRNARRNVVREMLRLVKPGGLVVVEDSAQLSDSPALAGVLRDFPKDFHEPFYEDYLADDLASLLGEAGFTDPRTEAHLVAKVVSAHRA